MRTDSIYYRLQRADKKGGTTYFLDLMIFLEEAEGDKFGQAAQLVGQWGFKTSKTSLNDGYVEAVSLWRLGRAQAFAQSTENLSTYDAETRRVIAQQTFQAIASPNLEPKILLGFAKLEVEKIKADGLIRRVKLLEDRAAEAKAKLLAVVKKSKGGLTPEGRKEIEEAAGLL